MVFGCDHIEAPTRWSNLAVAVVARRYFGTDPAGRPERSVRGLVGRVVEAIASWALEAGQLGSAEERDALRAELAALVLTQRGTFATPVWLNAGVSDRPLTSACFILQTADSIPELLDWNTREGMIFQQGGGAGINLSRIRSSRERVSRGGLASGPVSFMRATDAWAATIRAGGRARRGARRSCSTPPIPMPWTSSRPKALKCLGRRPETATTLHYGNVPVTLMNQVLTHAKKSLTETGHADAINKIRHLFQETMEADFREAVERLTGRKVLAFISGNHVDPDMAAEVFVLDGEL